MKIRIERAQCVGNARCHAVSEELFPLDDDGYIASDGFEVAGDAEAKPARNGARACPERIIVVIEDDGAQSWPPAGR